MSRRGYTSRPPVPEEREVNRLHAETVKKQKDATEAAAVRKIKRKEKHDKACKIVHAEGKPRPATPESTEEEGSSDAEINFSDDDEAATGAGSPPVYRGAGDEGVLVTLGEARLTPGSLVDPPPAGVGRRSPTPTAGRRPLASAAGGRSSAPAMGQRSSAPGAMQRSPAPAASERTLVLATGGGGSSASAGTPVQIASRPSVRTSLRSLRTHRPPSTPRAWVSSYPSPVETTSVLSRA